MSPEPTNLPEPWLRGTLADVPPVLRAVLHALQLAKEDTVRYCGSLTFEELHARPSGLPSVAFQLRHMAGSIDRLLTYAEGNVLSEPQLTALKSESDTSVTKERLFQEFDEALERAASRIRKLNPARLEIARTVGRKQLPTTVAGLLVHVADHTQRHVGQAVTTSKILLLQR